MSIVILNQKYSVNKPKTGSKAGIKKAHSKKGKECVRTEETQLIEVVFDSDRDRFIAVVVDKLGEVIFGDSDSGSVTSFSEFIDSLTSDYF